MRTPTPIPERDRSTLFLLLKGAKNKSEYQRVLCVWMRAAFGMAPDDVARAIGWSLGYVRQVQANYLKRGELALRIGGKGGRRRENMSPKEEQELLAPFFGKAERGEMLLVMEIKQAYEAKLGRVVPKSTVYRMLERHGWRKISPRPYHPKENAAAQEVFKNTSRKS